MEMKIEKHDDALDIESADDDEEIDDVKIDGGEEEEEEDEEDEDEDEDEDIDETDDDDDEDDSKEEDLGIEYQVQPIEPSLDEIEAASKHRKPSTENNACRGEDDD